MLSKTCTLENFYLLFSAIIGAILGGVSSLTINTMLVEISLNRTFSFYFGIIFIGVGVGMYIKSINAQYSEDSDYRKDVVKKVAALIVFVGFISFAINTSTLKSLSNWQKIPLYSLMGMTLSFTMIFCMLDMLNQCSSYVFGTYLVGGTKQIKMIFIIASITGIYFGILFGVLDLEDVNFLTFASEFTKDMGYCLPFGVLMGFIAGALNQYLVYEDKHYRRIPDFDEEI